MDSGPKKTDLVTRPSSEGKGGDGARRDESPGAKLRRLMEASPEQFREAVCSAATMGDILALSLMAGATTKNPEHFKYAKEVMDRAFGRPGIHIPDHDSSIPMATRRAGIGQGEQADLEILLRKSGHEDLADEMIRRNAEDEDGAGTE